jgi:hypothetical protein
MPVMVELSTPTVAKADMQKGQSPWYLDKFSTFMSAGKVLVIHQRPLLHMLLEDSTAAELDTLAIRQLIAEQVEEEAPLTCESLELLLLIA